jgi:hypothetical protein
MSEVTPAQRSLALPCKSKAEVTGCRYHLPGPHACNGLTTRGQCDFRLLLLLRAIS